MQIKILVLTLLAIPSWQFGQSYQTQPYKQQVETWISTHVEAGNKIMINQRELVMLANLLYFSFLRSASTLHAQEIATHAIEMGFQGYFNIAKLRMNPSVAIPYELSYHAQELLLNDFLDAQIDHRKIGKTYANCAEALVNGTTISSQTKESVMSLRETARIIVIEAFADVKKVLGTLFDYGKEYLYHDRSNDEIRFDIAQLIADFIPSVALKTFIETEKLNLEATKRSWEVFSTIMTIHKEIWKTVESARAGYYLAHYRGLMDIFEKYNLDRPVLLFDDNGLITQSNSLLPLPL